MSDIAVINNTLKLGTAQDLDENLEFYPFFTVAGNMYNIAKEDIINSEKQLDPSLFDVGTDMNTIYDLYEVLERERRATLKAEMAKEPEKPKKPKATEEPKHSDKGVPRKEPEGKKGTYSKTEETSTNEWVSIGIIGVILLTMYKYKK